MLTFHPKLSAGRPAKVLTQAGSMGTRRRSSFLTPSMSVVSRSLIWTFLLVFCAAYPIYVSTGDGCFQSPDLLVASSNLPDSNAPPKNPDSPPPAPTTPAFLSLAKFWFLAPLQIFRFPSQNRLVLVAPSSTYPAPFPPRSPPVI